MADLQVDLERASENIQSEESKIADSEALIVELQSLVTQHSEKIRHAEEALKNSMESAKSLNAEELELQARLKVLNEKYQALGTYFQIAILQLRDLDQLPEEVRNAGQEDEFLHNILYGDPAATEAAPADPMEWEDTNEQQAENTIAMDIDDAAGELVLDEAMLQRRSHKRD
uniref:Uncharacterized protein n=1 Tax=Ditylenchus dipsaci TaxID=166011 RepID=A0A915DY53_9BILA